MGLALGYALLPLPLGLLLEVFHSKKVRIKLILNYSLALSLLAIFDVRIFYIFNVVFVIISFLSVGEDSNRKLFLKSLKKIISVFLMSNFIVILLNFFWIYPLLKSASNPASSLNESYFAVESLKFFSFATLPNSMSFLHPNWPENIFGKVYFQNPLFLILSLLAFLPIVIGRINRKYVTFVFLALVGIFLSKGANDPLGILYVFLFQKIPGFQMFRDPTKWYILIAVSFSILLPVSLENIGQYAKRANIFKKNARMVFFSLFILIWSILIKDAIVGKLKGTFSRIEVPQEYVAFKNFLSKDESFSRVLWIPRQYKFTYANILHAAVEADPFFSATSSSEIVAAFHSKKAEEKLKRSGIGYVAIPYDSLGSLFLSDRKYDPRLRADLEREIDKISYLRKIKSGKLSVYKTAFDADLFLNDGRAVKFKGKQYSYTVDARDLKEGILLFSQNYNSSWRLFAGDKEFLPRKTYDNLIEFQIPKLTGIVKIEFVEQKNYNIGWAVSLVSLAILLLTIYYSNISSKKYDSKKKQR